MIEIIREHERYAIYIDGVFRCSCSNMEEVTEELRRYEERQNQGNHQTSE